MKTVKKEDCDKLFEILDYNSDGKIEAKELFASFIFAVDDSPEKLLNAFRLFDMGNKKLFDTRGVFTVY